MKRGMHKRVSELSAWGLDKGCRQIVNQSTEAQRRLKKIIRKGDRKRLNKATETEND